MKNFIARASYMAAVIAYVGTFSLGFVGRVQAAPVSYEGDIVDLTGDDKVTSSSINIGFTFQFYGTNFTTVDASTNGALTFDTKNTRYSNTALPSNVFAHVIFPFWDDLATDSTTAKSIYSKTIGDEGSRKFIMQWTNHSYCCGSGAPFGTFQVILFEGSNKIHLQYFNLIDDARARGSSATIGIQKDPSTANQYSYNEQVVSSDMAIEYTPDGSGGYTDGGHSTTFDPITLTAANTPGSAELTSPSDSATGVSRSNTVYRWKQSTNTDSYIVVVGKEPTHNFEFTYYTNNPQVVVTGDTLEPETVYYWRVVSVSSDDVFSYSAAHSFTTGTDNYIPDTVSNIGPASLTSGDTVDITTLLSTRFKFAVSDTDTEDTLGYEVLISPTNDPNGAVIGVYSANSAQGDRSYKYGQNTGTYFIGSSSTLLEDGASYYVFFRAIDSKNAAGPYNELEGQSFIYEATPGEDSDTISAATEDLAPNDGDANNDGFKDSWQANVTSVVNTITNSYSTLEATGCENITAIGIQAAPADTSLAGSYAYSTGLMNFTLECEDIGATATVAQYFYGVSSANVVARKYNATTKTFTTITGATITDVTIGGKSAVKVVYSVTDGGSLDQDGQANGVIVDPSGLAVFTASTVAAPNTGLQTESATPYVISMITGIAVSLSVLQRKKNNKQARI